VYPRYLQRLAAASVVIGLLVAGCSGRPLQAALRVLPPKPPPVPVFVQELTSQAEAVARGDEDGWLAPVDAGQPDLVARYRELFRSMRAIGVVTLTPIITASDVADLGPSPRVVLVGYAFCIQVTACPTTGLGGSGQPTETFFVQLTVTQQDKRAVIRKFDLLPVPSNGLGRAPWVDQPLVFRSGARVTVVAPASLQSRLPAAVADADAAAAVADRFAQWVWPVRYIVYLAGPDEWKSWIAGYPTDTNVVAYAAAASTSSDVVVVNVALQDTDANPLRYVLQHELGHVATLLGVSRNQVTAPQLFIEGIAEYIAEDGRPLREYLALPAARRYIHSGRWDGDLDSVELLFRSGNADDVEAAYGMGMLTMRCIADRYGRDKLLALVGKVLRESARAADAAPSTLGDPWATVRAACATDLRNA
jgi:hypothetical protein